MASGHWPPGAQVPPPADNYRAQPASQRWCWDSKEISVVCETPTTVDSVSGPAGAHAVHRSTPGACQEANKYCVYTETFSGPSCWVQAVAPWTLHRPPSGPSSPQSRESSAKYGSSQPHSSRKGDGAATAGPGRDQSTHHQCVPKRQCESQQPALERPACQPSARPPLLTSAPACVTLRTLTAAA
ncbi:hypothetical protein HaLaN_18484 [Haematococcus lacustris]|uniref:Uncharacterized protein n=1 Tax=Haematococcus lacustris TaxID=44745 RepID=A0A699ZQZ9_HAELA|nr:hypothetical protein HaLaN_18484 [Haematococcus lacustris]